MPKGCQIVPARCQFPIVLLHGLFGFVERRLGPFRFTYFRGVSPYLESVGNQVVSVAAPGCGRIQDRARLIAHALDSHPVLKSSPVNLIGHSMGGLDARYLITKLGYGDRVRSLTTIATPHRGSFLANALLFPGIGALSRRLIPALLDLNEEALDRFNEEIRDHPHTQYFSVPAVTSFVSCTPFLWLTYLLLAASRGPNDGQVPFKSAKWGEVLEEARADHFQLIGLRLGLNAWTGENHLDLYGRITMRLFERDL